MQGKNERGICDRVVEILKKHPEGLTINQIADEVGIHRHTLTKYIYELSGAGKISVRKVGVAKLCYINSKAGKKGQTDPASLGLLFLFIASISLLALNHAQVEVINPYSQPLLHENWTILFKTSGVGPLTIAGLNGTQIDDGDGVDDLQFIELRCGNNVFNPELREGVILLESYQCRETSYLVFREIMHGYHTVSIKFGTSLAYAHNYADCTATAESPCHMCNLTEMNYALYTNEDGFVSDGVMTSGGNPACTGSGDSEENYSYSLGYSFCPSENPVYWVVVAEAEGTAIEDELNMSNDASQVLTIDDFNDASNGWIATNLGGVTEGAGILYAYSTTNDAYMTLDIADFEADLYDYLIIKFRNVNGSDPSLYFYWMGDVCGSFSSTCGFVGFSVANLTNNDWHVYVLNLSADSSWTQTVTQVRIYPAYGTAGENFSIDYAILVNDTKSTLFTPDFDGDSNWCGCLMGADHHNIGGDIDPTGCCGNDIDENRRTKACSSICTSDASDDACCDDITDCVYSSTCYSSGQHLPSVIGAYCFQGTWINSTSSPGSLGLYYENLTSATTVKRSDNSTLKINITDVEGAAGISYVFGNLTKPSGTLGQNAVYVGVESIDNGSMFRYAGTSDSLKAAYSFEGANQTYVTDCTNLSNTGIFYGKTNNNGTLSYYENVLYGFESVSSYYGIFSHQDYNTLYTPNLGLNTSYYKQGDGSINFNSTCQYTRERYIYGDNITATDVSNKFVNIWVYIKDKKTLDKIENINLYLSDVYQSDTWSVWEVFSVSEIDEGWNLLSFNSSTYDGSSGTPNLAQMGNFRLMINATQHNQIFSGGDIVVDDFFVTPYSPAGPQWNYGSDCKFGNCLVFDGGDDFVRVDDAAALRPSSAFTITAWIKPDAEATLSDFRTIISKEENTSFRNYWLGLWDNSRSSYCSDGVAAFTFTVAGVNKTACGSTDLAATSAWHHIAAVYNGSGIALYVDGSLENNTADSGNADTQASYAMFIGVENASTPGGFFDGSIDNVRLWSIPLVSSDVTSDKSSYYPTERTQLVGWWAFDEGNGSIAYDNQWKASGKYGAGAGLDGSDDYIQVADASSLMPSTAFTITSWVKPESEATLSDFRTIISKEENTSFRNYWLGLWDNSRSSYCSDGVAAFTFTVAGVNKTACGSTDLAATSAWHHIAAVYNGSGIALYVDGSLENNTADSGNADTQASYAMFIGVENESTKGGYFNGTVDDIRLYSKALTQTEVRQIKDMAFNPMDVGNEKGTWSVYTNVNDTARISVVTVHSMVVADEIPIYRTVMVNDSNSTIDQSATVNMSAEWWDDVLLHYAWLETNESGSWSNHTCGSASCYSSPIYENSAATWAQSNFTWYNSSIPAGTDIGWRIWANDSYANVNGTEIQILNVRDYNPPTYVDTYQNTSNPEILAGVNLSTVASDEYLVHYAILETNESGYLRNKSFTLLNSPNITAYFEWGNTTMFPGQTVQWRIWLNDSYGQYNVTEAMQFHLNLSVIFEYTTGDRIYSSAAVADTDADGVMDVIIGSDDKKLYAFNGTTGASKWNFTTGSSIGSSPTLANVTGDGMLEVIIGSLDNKVYVINSTSGDNIVNYSTGNMIWSSPIVLDIDGDDEKELIAGSADGKLYTFNIASGGGSGSSLCYQETANTSTSCGGLATGEYSMPGTAFTSQNLYDGNWTSWDGASLGDDYFYVNYTKPVDSTEAMWEVKYSFNADTLQKNFSVNSSWCWDGDPDKLVFRIATITLGDSGYYNISCFNSTEWIVFETQWGGEYDTSYLAEEGIWWNISTSSESSLTSKWNYTTDGIIWSSPIISDLNNDSEYDILIGSYDNTLYALNKSGQSMWNFTAGDDIESVPVVADFGSDYKQIVFGSYDTKVYCIWANNGSQVWSYDGDDWFISSPNYGDIDGDSENETIIGSDDGTVYAFNHDGTHLWNYTLSSGGRIESSPALADMNGDGIWDVVFGSSDNYVYAIKGTDASLIWKYGVGGYVYSSPTLEDITGDGRYEVIVGTFGHKVIILDPTWDRFGGNAGRTRVLDESDPECLVTNSSNMWVGNDVNVTLVTYWKDPNTNLAYGWFTHNATGNLTMEMMEFSGLSSWFNGSFIAPEGPEGEAHSTTYYMFNVTDTFGNTGEVDGFVNTDECVNDADCLIIYGSNYRCFNHLCAYVAPEAQISSGPSHSETNNQTQDLTSVSSVNASTNATTSDNHTVAPSQKPDNQSHISETEQPEDKVNPVSSEEADTLNPVPMLSVAAALVILYGALHHKPIKAKRRKTKTRKRSRKLAAVLLAITFMVFLYVLLGSNQVTSPGRVSTSDGLVVSIDHEKHLGVTGGITAMVISQPQRKIIDVNLKTNPYGFVVAEGWDISQVGKDDKIRGIIAWSADASQGAGDIYVGYSLDGAQWHELGPYSMANGIESLDIGQLTEKELSGLKLRFRGRDMDRMYPAFAKVDFALETY